MTNEELKKLSRKDLLELLVAQGREQEKLQAELEQAKKDLREQELHIEPAGSIAEAALQVNGVFEAAQAAAQQYLYNIKQRTAQTEEDCALREEESRRKAEEAQRTIDQRLEEARQKADTMEAEASEKCRAMEAEVTARCQAMEARTSEKCRTMEAETQQRCQELTDKTQQQCRAREETARQQSDAYWTEVSARLESFYQEHEALRELLAGGGRHER